MKKVLVTGAAGAIGIQTVKYLLSEGKYEITILDLKNSRSHKILKKYKNRVNIIYGDICNRVLMEALIKDHDYVIHLASSLFPLGQHKKSLSKIIEHDAVENIVRSINYYNPACHLIYASTTSVYGDVESASIKNKIQPKTDEYYTYYKYKSEQLITSKLKHYTIVRVPLVVNGNKVHNFIYNIKNSSNISFITDIDAGYFFTKILDHIKASNKKTINIKSSYNEELTYKDLRNKIIKATGFEIKLILNKIFVENNFYSPSLTDTETYVNKLNYQIDSLENCLKRLKRKSKNKYINLALGKMYFLIRGTK